MVTISAEESSMASNGASKTCQLVDDECSFIQTRIGEQAGRYVDERFECHAGRTITNDMYKLPEGALAVLVACGPWLPICVECTETLRRISFGLRESGDNLG